MTSRLGSSPGTFGDDLAFLREHVPDIVVLSGPHGRAQVALSPSLQGKVLTSASRGRDGLSYGWINRELLASGKVQEHINVHGGEDRFWIGPEGGQYSVFFRKGVAFDLEHWFTPPPFDTEPFLLVTKSANIVHMRKDMTLENYSGTRFDLTVDRVVHLLGKREIAGALGSPLPRGIRAVAFESLNKMTNTGKKPWTAKTGLLSIWILGMFNPSPATTIVVPFVPGPEDELGPVVNDTYFGKVPADRLVKKEDVLFFRGDGRYRSKIGLLPTRARPVLGSYDAKHGVLTIVQYNKPSDATDYVNSMWEIQEKPYGGDVVNSYNDGPPKPGAKPLGPFYELETSSKAASLGPGESIDHVHRTFHLEGSESALDPVARRLLGVGIREIGSVFGGE
ncbi:MAG: hypothetical protein HQ559_14760 [Lentisphaerae bacterium]|nr:hypothetical protein [Lentisphaerota bacterium]